MKLQSLIAIAGLATMVTGCATVFEGTDQSVGVATNPPGASCNVTREGAQIGTVSPTPGSIKVSKSKNDLTFACSKPGFQPVTVSHSPSFNGTTFGNIILGGGIGAVVDASTGANYDYPNQVNIDLPPEAAPAPTAPAAAPAAPAPTGKPKGN